MAAPSLSIIIRSYNEERWIGACLEGVFNQTLKDFEVVLVDNCSTGSHRGQGAALRSADRVDPRLSAGKGPQPGNPRIRGEYIVCLSAHCIPVDENWLANLHRNFSDQSVAGVYGRQEPMSFTSDSDKRDLLTVFGLDHKVQIKDSFFHNANSMVRRDIWEQIPFDENTTNIEDRLWAQAVLKERLPHRLRTGGQRLSLPRHPSKPESRTLQQCGAHPSEPER